MLFAKNGRLNMHDKIRLIILGDVVGIPGRALAQKHVQRLKHDYKADGIIINGENSASDGRGITPRIMHFFKHIGADVVTSGNHIFQKKDIYSYLASHKDLLRPANFPASCPGSGVGIYTIAEHTVGVVNIQGRIFMRELLSCPFRALESAITYLKSKTNIIIVDMHAETTSEKSGIALYFDGQVSLVVGTHTHIQTADERILPGGTGFITDLGMGGSLNSMIGMKKESVLTNMLSQMPSRFEVDLQGPFVLSGIVVDIDTTTGKAIHIERIRIIDRDLVVNLNEHYDK